MYFIKLFIKAYNIKMTYVLLKGHSFSWVCIIKYFEIHISRIYSALYNLQRSEAKDLSKKKKGKGKKEKNSSTLLNKKLFALYFNW